MVTDAVDEEHIGPFAAARRPRFDPREIDAIGMKRHQQLMQRARLVAHGNDDRGFVITGGRYFLAADDKKARGIVRAILDFFGNFFEDF